MILHTLSALPDTPACSDCLQLLAPGDALLLLGDGTYAGLRDNAVVADPMALGIAVYALAPDAAARGIAQQLLNGVQAIDMEGFVELTERFPRQQAWY